jgi:hypothetical protein
MASNSPTNAVNFDWQSVCAFAAIESSGRIKEPPDVSLELLWAKAGLADIQATRKM